MLQLNGALELRKGLLLIAESLFPANIIHRHYNESHFYFS